MSCYFNKTLNLSFDSAIAGVKKELKKEGFGMVTEINDKISWNNTMYVHHRRYKILGTCSPPFKYGTVQVKDTKDIRLPCNVLVQEISDRKVRIMAIDSLVSMQPVENQVLKEIAVKINNTLKTIIDRV